MSIGIVVATPLEMASIRRGQNSDDGIDVTGSPPQRLDPSREGPLAIPALTGVRFAFALAVVVFHQNFPGGGLDSLAWSRWPAFLHQLVSAGFTGVQGFFILSGFILTHTYHGLPPDRDVGFYRARVARIYPVFLFGCLLAMPNWPHSGWEAVLLLPLWLLLLHGWVGFPVSGNLPDWSLSVEAFFYAVFPPMVRWLERLTTSRLVLIAGGMWSLALADATVRQCITDPTFNRFIAFNPLTHLPAFVIGVIACLLLRRGVIPERAVRRMSVLSLAALAVTCGALFQYLSSNLLFMLLIPAFTGLIVGLTVKNAVSGFFASRPLVVLGEASYALYVLHWLWYGYLRKSAEALHYATDRLEFFIAYLVILVLASLATHRLIEEPLRRLIRGARKPRVRIAQASWRPTAWRRPAGACAVFGSVALTMVMILGILERWHGDAAYRSEVALTTVTASLPAPPSMDDPGVIRWQEAVDNALQKDGGLPMAGLFACPGFDAWLLSGHGPMPVPVRDYWKNQRQRTQGLAVALHRHQLAIGVLPAEGETVPTALMEVQTVGVALQIGVRADAEPGPWLDALDELQAALIPIDSASQAQQLLQISRLRDQAYLATALVGRLDPERTARWLAEPADQFAWLLAGVKAQRRLVDRRREDAEVARGLVARLADHPWPWRAWRDWCSAGTRAAQVLATLRREEARLDGGADAADPDDSDFTWVCEHTAIEQDYHRLTRMCAAVLDWRQRHGALPADGSELADGLGPLLPSSSSGFRGLRYHRDDAQRFHVDADAHIPASPGLEPGRQPHLSMAIDTGFPAR